MSAHRTTPGRTSGRTSGKALGHAFALALMGVLALMLALLLPAAPAPAQAPPWQSPPPRDDTYRPPASANEPYYPPGADPKKLPGEAYPGPYDGPAPYGYDGPPRTFSSNEIVDAGHRFFGATTKGLA